MCYVHNMYLCKTPAACSSDPLVSDVKLQAKHEFCTAATLFCTLINTLHRGIRIFNIRNSNISYQTLHQVTLVSLVLSVTLVSLAHQILYVPGVLLLLTVINEIKH
jgi:hypothetical protein